MVLIFPLSLERCQLQNSKQERGGKADETSPHVHCHCRNVTAQGKCS